MEKGLAFNPQGRVVFPDMTVQEHLDMGAWTIKDQPDKQKALERVYLLFPWLAEGEEKKGFPDERWRTANAFLGESLDDPA